MKSVIYKSNLKNNYVYIKGMLLGIISCTGVIMLLLAICAFVLAQTGNIPLDIVNIIVAVIEGLGVFCGSFIALKIIKTKGIIWGTVLGLILFTIIFIAGLISSSATIGIFTLIKLIVAIICGAIGGITSVN